MVSRQDDIENYVQLGKIKYKRIMLLKYKIELISYLFRVVQARTYKFNSAWKVLEIH